MFETTTDDAESHSLLASLPVEVAAAASIADAQDGTGSTRELMAAINTFQTGAMLLRHNELVQSVFDEYKSDGQGEARLLKLSQDPPPDLIEQTLIRAQAATSMLNSRVNQDEAAEYKNWLSSMATEIVLTSRAGGFLGFGGTRLTENEVDFINLLNRALGIETRSE